MRLYQPDPLWPVVLGASLLFGGTLLVEGTVGSRHVQRQDITIPMSAGDLSEDESGGEAPEEAVTSPRHAEARSLARRGEVDAALAIFDELLLASPDAGRLRAEQGYWLLTADRDRAALVALERASGEDPTDPWTALTLGRVRSKLGDDAGAEADFRRALASRPSYSSAMVSLGVNLRHQGRLDEAIELLERASASGGNLEVARAKVAFGRALLAAGRVDEASAAFEQAVLLAPADVELRLGIGRAWMNEGGGKHLSQAIAVLDEAVRVAPDVPQLYSALGRAQEHAGAPDLALRAYRRALQLDPTYAYVQRRVIRLALSSGSIPEARAQIAYLLEVAPDDPENHMLAGRVAAAAEHPDEAREHFRKAIDLSNGAYPEASYNLGIFERREGEMAAAVAAYRAALAARPDYSEAANNLGLALVDAGDGAAAEATWRELLARRPDAVSAWLNLGSYLADQERYDEAIDAYHRALEVRPGYDKALLNLGVALRRANRDDEAIATYRELVKTHPAYASGWYNLGVALKHTKQSDDARDALQHALNVDEDHRAARRALASLEAKEGRVDVALALYADLLDREPGDVDSRLGYGRALRDSGKAAACADQARAVLALEPTSDKARSLLAQCGQSTGETP